MAFSSQQMENTDLQSFLAMLGEDSGLENKGLPLTTEVQSQDRIFDYVLAALNPADGSTHGQNPDMTNIDLGMIDDVIRQSDESQMDMMTNSQQVVDHESSPQFCSEFFDACLSPPEEVVQNELIQNPSIIPLTTDTSQLQDSQMSQTMSTLSTDMSESMSVDPASDTANENVSSPVYENSVQVQDEESMEAAGTRADEPPKLPDFEELLIRIRYRSQEVERKHIRNNQGCLVFYNKAWMFPQLPNKPDYVQFPDITQKAEMTESQYKFTEQVLKALDKGLFLRCDRYGNVYATRYCRSKIFWYSTEKGPIAEAHGNHGVPNLTFQKLERNKEVIVFDNMLFQRKLLHYVVNKPTFKNEAASATANMHTIPISPAIFFTFAQSWNPLTSALSSCLVSMVVNPVRARMQRQWGNEDRHESYDVSTYGLQMSSAEAGEKS